MGEYVLVSSHIRDLGPFKHKADPTNIYVLQIGCLALCNRGMPSVLIVGILILLVSANAVNLPRLGRKYLYEGRGR